MKKHPSLKKIIRVDYPAFAAVIFPIAFWGFYGVLLLLDRSAAADITLLGTDVAITAVSAGVLIWRVKMIYDVFAGGDEKSAAISNVSFFQNRGRIDFQYSFQGHKYQSSSAVMKTKQTAKIQVGERVKVMVDREHPKRAYIKDLYL